MNSERTRPAVRRATEADAPAVARLLDAFNHEYDEPTPGVDVLATRAARMIANAEIVVLLVGDGPAGLAQLASRASIWADAPDMYLAELYVIPERRGEGLGRALLAAAIEVARAAGSAVIDLSTSEDDVAARGLYAAMGFTDRERGSEGPRLLYFEREL